ncbi:MAG: hypothetical protein ACK5HA_05995 [Planctomycetaceae bacterium]|jgi:hypothetical protein
MNDAVLYGILRGVAANRGVITYAQLSDAYPNAEGDPINPQYGWNQPLGELNVSLHRAGCPPLSAVVISQERNEPGNGFWGSAPNVPPRPTNEIERLETWHGLLDQVYGHRWPEQFPGQA